MHDIRAYRDSTNLPQPHSSLSFTTGHPLTLEAPASTNTNKVFVQGYARPGESVTVSAEGYGALRTLTANQAGRYSGTVTLPNIEQSKDIKLIATSVGKTSNSVNVRYSKRLLYTRELWMHSKQAGSFDKSYLLMNNSVQTVDGAPAIVDAQSGKTQNIMLGDDVKFRVRMSDNSAVQKVFVSVERADGSAMGSIPCAYQPGTGYWESETQDGTVWSGAAGFRVTYVLNLGHEYISPGELEANMRASEAAMVAWTPPQLMVTNPEDFENELKLALLEALPPELRGASYTPIAGGKTRVDFTTADGLASYDVLLTEMTGAALATLAAKAQTDGVRMGGSGYLYSEVKYNCTLNGGGTRTYEGDAFDRAIFNQKLLYPTESTAQILSNRLGISNVSMETTTFSSALQGATEGFVTTMDMTSTAVGLIGDVASFLGHDLDLGALGSAAGKVGTVMTIISAGEIIGQAVDARDVADGYFAMLANLRGLVNSECYKKLSPSQQALFNQRLAAIENYESDFENFKSRHTRHAIGKGLYTAVTTAIGMAPGIGLGVKIGTTIASVVATNSKVDLFGDNEIKAQLEQYKGIYNTLTELNNMMKESLAVACGEKKSEKTQGNYNMTYDPQGIVYDGTLDYPVAGVRAELWTATDGSGAGARYWSEAADYDQINPQITEADGMFSWFTPEGWWQVRIFDNTTNAPLAKSEWLKVLPPHFGVNLNIGSDPLKITYEGNGGELPMMDFDPNDELFPGILNDPFLAMPDLPQTEFLVPQGKNHTVIANPFTVTDLVFAGWNTKADGSGTAYAPGVSLNVQSDVTLYAQWKAKEAGGDPEAKPDPTPPPLPPPPPPDKDKGGGQFGQYTQTPAWVNPFDDVDEGDWFYGDVRYVNSNGLMVGTSASTFSPNTPLTRGMAVTVLYRIAGEPDATGLPNPFDDVAGGQYYAGAVKWAAANGIVLGYPGGVFRPETMVSRQDLAVILNRYAGFKGTKPPDTRDYAGFDDDTDIADYAKDAVKTFFSAGIIHGRPNNLFDPNGQATRAEYAAMIHRLLETAGK